MFNILTEFGGIDMWQLESDSSLVSNSICGPEAEMLLKSPWPITNEMSINVLEIYLCLWLSQRYAIENKNVQEKCERHLYIVSMIMSIILFMR